jgi:hypothetical protein
MLTTDRLGFWRGQFLQHLENKPNRPFSRSAVQGQSNSGCFQNLFFARPEVSSTADMVLDSAITLLRDTDAQSDEFLVFARQGAVFQSIHFEIFKLAEGADAAAEHRLIALLAGSSYFTDFIEHRSLLE